MSILTSALYDLLVSDTVLAGLLASYNGEPAIFTIDPVPGDARLPYIVTAGEVSQSPNDTKNSRGRDLIRDLRCYAAANGSAIVVESMAERVRYILHRKEIYIDGWLWQLTDAGGPIVADEADVYGRIVSVRFVSRENTEILFGS